MLELSDYIYITLFGCLGAFISGFLGVGGGIIYIPVLDYFLSKLGMHDDVLVKGILANSLFTIIFSGSVSSFKQYKIGNFFPKEILHTAIPGIASALVLTHLIKSGTWYVRSIYLYVFAALLLVIIVRMFFAKPTSETSEIHIAKNYQYNLTGFFSGIITAFSGLGGGVIMTPVFTDILKQNIKKASSISNGVIPLFAILVGIHNLITPAQFVASQWQIGYVIFPVVLPMILAAFVFAPMGVKASQKSNQKTIRFVFVTFASIIFINILYELFIKK